MSDAEHTPGPWELTFPFATNPVALIFKNGVGDISSIYRVSPTERNAGVETDEAKANARLIAAAPELLEALEIVVAIMNWEEVHPTVEKFDAIIARAESVIRKAKGEL